MIQSPASRSLIVDLSPWCPSVEQRRSREITDSLLRSLLLQIESDRRRALGAFGLQFPVAGDDNNDDDDDVDADHVDDVDAAAPGGEATPATAAAAAAAWAFEWAPASNLPEFYSRRHLQPQSSMSSTFRIRASRRRLLRRGGVSSRVVGGGDDDGASASAGRGRLLLRRFASTAAAGAFRSVAALRTPQQPPPTAPTVEEEAVAWTPLVRPPSKRRRHPAGADGAAEAAAAAAAASADTPEAGSPVVAASSTVAGRLRDRLLGPIRRYFPGGVGDPTMATSTPRGRRASSSCRGQPSRRRRLKATKSGGVQLRLTDMFCQQKKYKVCQTSADKK